MQRLSRLFELNANYVQTTVDQILEQGCEVQSLMAQHLHLKVNRFCCDPRQLNPDLQELLAL